MGKHKKKYKKTKSSKNVKHKSSKKNSSSEDSSSSEEEWVEIPPTPTISASQFQNSETKQKPKNISSDLNDWVSNPALHACVSREEIKRSREEKRDKTGYDKYMLDKLGQADRELNPYWKDGGSGLPSETSVTKNSLIQPSVKVGDQGGAWLRKALQRAKEQAAEQGCSLQQVVAEHWGSLEKLESMIAAAEEQDKNRGGTGEKKNRFRLDYQSKKCSDNRLYDKVRDNKYINRQIRFNDHNMKKQKQYSNKFVKPHNSDDDSSSDESKSSKNTSSCRDFDKYNQNEEIKKNTYAKQKSSKSDYDQNCVSNSSDNEEDHSKKDRQYPKGSKYEKKLAKRSYSCSDDEDTYLRSKEREIVNKQTNDVKRTFIKPQCNSDNNYSVSKVNQIQSFTPPSKGWKKKTESHEHKVIKSEQKVETKEPKDVILEMVEEYPKNIGERQLDDKEMNELGAKLLKAELLGNLELAKDLKIKLDKARELKASKPTTSAEKNEEVVILTHTDSKGFTRPVSFTDVKTAVERRKPKKVETHSGGKRMRYFADDDKYSLQEIFQKEKLNAVEDSNQAFLKIALKGVGPVNSGRDMEDVFEETASIKNPDGKTKATEKKQAIEQSKRVTKSVENCQWCLESRQMLKHLVIAIGSTCYLCVPPHQSLTENHCLIVPVHHTACATQLDEDVWQEIQDFRRSLVQMFLLHDEDVVFFESVRYLNKFPHMVINCVSMPKDVGDLAPIYFKKAILECEYEWSHNKKLVDLKGRDIRRAVPKGLPYFAVDFGMESGFAHVIEDEKFFPHNFAQEIIGGMLDLDHTVWRKQKKETFENQSKKVIRLSKMWNSFREQQK